MDKDKLVYCGHRIYADFETGSLFEKTASGDLVEINDEIIEAEKRFINKKLEEGSLDG